MSSRWKSSVILDYNWVAAFTGKAKKARSHDAKTYVSFKGELNGECIKLGDILLSFAANMTDYITNQVYLQRADLLSWSWKIDLCELPLKIPGHVNEEFHVKVEEHLL